MKNKILIILVLLFIIVIFLVCFFKDNKKEGEQIKDVATEIEEMEKIDIFSAYHDIANKKIEKMTLDEKIGQIFLSRLPNENKIEAIKEYKLGGYLLFEKDFKERKEEEIKSEIASFQENSKIPLLIAVDEEGGKVVRISSNENLVQERFKSPSELYSMGGFEKIKEDTIEKSKILYNLGVNLNLAPVVDVSTNPNDYIYQRTLGQDVKLTSIYAKTVIEASKKEKVSYTLKHFPGYGNNVDTHKSTAIDNRTYEEIINNGIPPFIEGIKAGAEAVLVSHNIVNSIDKDNPASLSKPVHDLLKDKLKFTGVIITDDLYMGAVANDNEAVIKAINAGNDLIIVTDYAGSIEKVKNALGEGRISEEQINNMAKKVIEWKYFKELI